MLKNPQHHYRVYKSYQQFCEAPMSNKTARQVLLVQSLLKFGYNGVNKFKFMRKLKIDSNHFARDTKALRELGFIKLIDNEVIINPRFCFAGSDRLKEYRVKCWDQDVLDLSDQPSDDFDWLDYIKSRVEVGNESND
jgi:hypothetical protein